MRQNSRGEKGGKILRGGDFEVKGAGCVVGNIGHDVAHCGLQQRGGLRSALLDDAQGRALHLRRMLHKNSGGREECYIKTAGEGAGVQARLHMLHRHRGQL